VQSFLYQPETLAHVSEISSFSGEDNEAIPHDNTSDGNISGLRSKEIRRSQGLLR
jgi:hypothetical protein